jgi:hypothetical protein
VSKSLGLRLLWLQQVVCWQIVLFVQSFEKSFRHINSTVGITACLGRNVLNGTSLFQYYLEKHCNLQGDGSLSPRLKGGRLCKLKVNPIVLLCPKNCVFLFPSSKTVNTEFYLQVLESLRKCISLKVFGRPAKFSQ